MIQAVRADATQITNTVTLKYLSVQISYPSEILPGQTMTVNIQAKATDYFRLVSLTLDAYYSDGTSLRKVGTYTVFSDVSMSQGNVLNKDVQVTVPLDVPRTSLIAVLSESVRVTYSYYDYSYVYYPYVYYYPYNYSYYYYYPAYYMYPTYYYVTVSDTGVTSLSYIKATTPEYQTLQTDYQNLQQQLSNVQAQNQQLQQELQTQQNLVAQKDAALSTLNTQLASAQSLIQILNVAILVLTGLIIALGIFLWKRAAKAKAQQAPATTAS